LKLLWKAQHLRNAAHGSLFLQWPIKQILNIRIVVVWFEECSMKKVAHIILAVAFLSIASASANVCDNAPCEMKKPSTPRQAKISLSLYRSILEPALNGGPISIRRT
jgi:hypothetical protein